MTRSLGHKKLFKKCSIVEIRHVREYVMLTPATHMYMYEIKDGMKLYWLFPLLKKEVRIIIKIFPNC